MIKNCNLWNTWALACYAVDKYGVLVPSGPNYTSNPDYVPTNIKEVTMTIEHGPASINQMLNKQLPPLYPQKQGVDSYINQMTAGTDEFEHGRTFHYTYGLRLREMPCGCEYIDQLDFIAEHLDAFNKRLQAITWIPNVDLPSTIVDELKQSVPCYDIYTEVLTYSGWKLFKDVSYKDKIMTLNSNTNKIEYHTPINLISYKYNDNLIYYEGNNINFAVTPNHNMYIGNKNCEYKLCRADSLPSLTYVKSDGEWCGKEIDTITLGTDKKQYNVKMDDFLKFLAIYLCDGDTSTKAGVYRVRLTTKYHIDEYRKIFQSLCDKFNVREEKDVHSEGCLHLIVNNKNLAMYTRQLGKGKNKVIPEFIKTLSSRQINIFLDTWKLGDFHTSGKTNRYTSTSKQMIDTLQELVIKNNKKTSANIWSRKDVEYYELKETPYKYGSYILQENIKYETYNNMVYCVEVPNSIIMVRRNGCAMWCGNCLQRIRIENYYDKYYVLFVDWRSRDLYKAHPYNLVGLINAIDKLIQEKRAEQGKSKLELFKIVEFIDSLHVYAPELDMLNKVPVDAKTIMNCLYI